MNTTNSLINTLNDKNYLMQTDTNHFIIKANSFIINNVLKTNHNDLLINTIALASNTYVVYLTADSQSKYYGYELVIAGSLPIAINYRSIGVVSVSSGLITVIYSEDKLITNIMVTMSADQSFSASASTLIQFDTKLIDTKNEFASYTFTCTSSGIYLINVNIYWESDTSNNRALLIYKNGIEYVKTSLPSQTAEVYGQNMTQIINLSTGDTIKIYARHESTGTPDVLSSNSRLNILQIK